MKANRCCDLPFKFPHWAGLEASGFLNDASPAFEVKKIYFYVCSNPCTNWLKYLIEFKKLWHLCELLYILLKANFILIWCFTYNPSKPIFLKVFLFITLCLFPFFWLFIMENYELKSKDCYHLALADETLVAAMFPSPCPGLFGSKSKVSLQSDLFEAVPRNAENYFSSITTITFSHLKNWQWLLNIKYPVIVQIFLIYSLPFKKMLFESRSNWSLSFQWLIYLKSLT